MADIVSSGRSLISRIAGRLIGRGSGWSGNPGPLTAPPHYTDEGWIPSNWPINFGQVGWDPIPNGWNSVVYACIMLYARTIAQLPGSHKRTLPDDGTETVTGTALARIMRKPNDYETPSDFMMNLVISLLAEGNGYALGLRNERGEFKEFHRLPQSGTRPLIAEDGTIFYSIGGNPVLDYRLDPAFGDGKRWIVPQRDILHIRGPASKSNPLVGESPLVAANLPVTTYSGGFAHLWRFFTNMSRPSGVLSTDLVLDKTQVAELRSRWEEQSKGIAMGGVPILTAGLKWQQFGIQATDIAIAEQLKLSVADIARIFGVPLALINDMNGATYSNTEVLMTMWLRQGLGFYVNHIELAFDKTFEIDKVANEYTELDIEMLLRPTFKERIEGLVRAITGGLYAPNEARKKEGLRKVKGGDEPRVQQQQVPLSWEAPEAAPAPAPAPAPAEDAPAEDGPDEAAKAIDLAAGRSMRVNYMADRLERMPH